MAAAVLTKERKIVEIGSYTETLGKMPANVQKLADLALATKGDYLRFLAHDCQVIRGRKFLRALETKPIVMTDGTTIPAFTLWFEISRDDEEVQLVAIEAKRPD